MAPCEQVRRRLLDRHRVTCSDGRAGPRAAFFEREARTDGHGIRGYTGFSQVFTTLSSFAKNVLGQKACRPIRRTM